MLTRALVSLVNVEVPDWSRIKILTYLNEIQKIIFAQNATSPMRIYDSSTGQDYKITTNSSTREYNINTTNGFSHNAWRVCEVYAEDIDDPELDIQTFDATARTPYARIVFPEIPSGDYYVRCYRSPVELSSESVELEIPDAYHLSHVYEGIMGFIEKARSGRSDRWDMWVKKWLPDLVKRMSDNKHRSRDVQYSNTGE